MDRLRNWWADAHTRREAALGVAATLPALVVLTTALVPLRSRLEPLTIGLVYLLLVVVLAARWGWAVGVIGSVAANLTFNFFFVPPLYRFAVAEPENAFDLLIFLAVAALTSALLGRARTGEASARRREQETAVLYDLSRLVIVAPATAETLGAICGRVQATFETDACAILVPVAGHLEQAAARGSVVARPMTAYERAAAEEALVTGEVVMLGERGRRRPRIVGIPDRGAPIIYLPLRVGQATVGVLEVVGALRARVTTPDALRLLTAFAGVAALAVDRDRLLREAAQAEALQETNRLKSALLSAVSHDLRTPLAAIKTSASSLLDPEVAWDDATRNELLTGIDEETDRLTRLVANLLDLSRIEGGALRPDLDRYDVREMLETVTGRLSRIVARHHLMLDIAEDTGEASFDYVQIGQVVANLVENAAKLAPDGTTIRVMARRLPAAIETAVEDDGPGVPIEERARIFEPFYRAHRAGRTGTGAGLGLAISKGLVEAHGGRIWVEDAPGGGARFVFTLPDEVRQSLTPRPPLPPERERGSYWQTSSAEVSPSPVATGEGAGG